MSHANAHSLFSFLLITYNQEKYIEAAINSALAQEIDNLEIVICDDCSTDRTFEIAQRVTSEYKGPFRIVLHRNSSNLGIAGNFYMAYTLSTGEWLFMAAGDDISLPNRCQVIRRAIPEYPKALAFDTNYQVIDENGTPQGFFAPEIPVCLGAVICWHRSLFSDFPPLGKRSCTEDIPLLTRVFFKDGAIVKLPENTLQYRVDGHSFTGEKRQSAIGVKRYQIKVYQAQIEGVRQRLDDLDYAHRQSIAVPFDEQFQNRLHWEIDSMSADIENYQLCIDVLTASLWKKLHYLVTPNALFLHHHFRQCLRLVLSSMVFLRFFKRLVSPPKSQLQNLQKELLKTLPSNLKPIVVTAEDYLNSEQCDYYQPEDKESFVRDCLEMQTRIH